MKQKVFHCIVHWSKMDDLSKTINEFIKKNVLPEGYTVKQISSSAVSQQYQSGSLEMCFVVLILAEKL